MNSDINLKHLAKLESLPNGWAHSSVNELCVVEPVGNKKLAQKQYLEYGDYPVIDQGAVFIGGYSNDKNLVVEPPKDGAYLIFGDHSRAFKLVDFSFIPGADGVKVLKPICVLPKWIYYFCQAIPLPNKGYARHFQYLKEAYLPLPPLSNQKLIVEKIEELFSHIDAGVEGLKQAKAKLQQYRQSVLKDAVTGKLTEQWREKNAEKLEPASTLLARILDKRRANWEAEQLKAFEEKGQLPKNDKWKEKYIEPENPETNDVPEIPREWGYLRLEALAAIQGGITVDAKRKYENTTSLPYLRVANVQRGYLDLFEIKDIQVPNDKLDSLLLENGDILFNEGGDRDKLGRGWVWRSEIDKCTYQNHVFRARLFSSDVVPEFVSIFGNTIGKEYFIKQGKQTTNLASINKTKLSAFPVPVCSKEEMLEIMEIVDSKIAKTDRMINEVDSQLVRASGLKSTILSKAFMGQLVDNTTSEETAEHLLEKILAEKALLEQKAKLVKKKPTARAKKMKRRPVLDVLIESKKALNVDELFELSGFQGEITPEKVEEFYQELKDVTAIKGVKVTPVKVGNVKQGDLFEYKEVKPNEA